MAGKDPPLLDVEQSISPVSPLGAFECLRGFFIVLPGGTSMTDDKQPPGTAGADPSPPNFTTVGDKSREAQNHGSTTSTGSQHNYQTSNATEPEKLAEIAADNLQRFTKPHGAEETRQGDAEGDFRQHDAGG